VEGGQYLNRNFFGKNSEKRDLAPFSKIKFSGKICKFGKGAKSKKKILGIFGIYYRNKI
jgi:hypothetical protein